VHWDFDKSAELKSRLYDYNGIGFEYMPSDTKADAGTHFKKDDGRIFTSHEHFHESKLVKFTEPIGKSEPLWFLHQVFGGEIDINSPHKTLCRYLCKMVFTI